jgi:hypothetical protein
MPLPPLVREGKGVEPRRPTALAMRLATEVLVEPAAALLRARLAGLGLLSGA